MVLFHVQSWNKWTELFNLNRDKIHRDDKAVGVNHGKLVIHIVTCMIMIRSYIPEFSTCTSCCWCIQNQMAGSTQRIKWRSPLVSGRVIFTFCQISDFCSNFTLFLNFHSFINYQKARKAQSVVFSSITTCKSRFFPKNWLWALRCVSVAIVTNFQWNCRNIWKKCWKLQRKFLINYY